jgi:hypothetical protein
MRVTKVFNNMRQATGLGLLGLMLVLAGCGGGGGTTSLTPPAALPTVTAFAPAMGASGNIVSADGLTSLGNLSAYGGQAWAPGFNPTNWWSANADAFTSQFCTNYWTCATAVIPLNNYGQYFGAGSAGPDGSGQQATSAAASYVSAYYQPQGASFAPVWEFLTIALQRTNSVPVTISQNSTLNFNLGVNTPWQSIQNGPKVAIRLFVTGSNCTSAAQFVTVFQASSSAPGQVQYSLPLSGFVPVSGAGCSTASANRLALINNLSVAQINFEADSGALAQTVNNLTSNTNTAQANASNYWPTQMTLMGPVTFSTP